MMQQNAKAEAEPAEVQRPLTGLSESEPAEWVQNQDQQQKSALNHHDPEGTNEFKAQD